MNNLFFDPETWPGEKILIKLIGAPRPKKNSRRRTKTGKNIASAKFYEWQQLNAGPLKWQLKNLPGAVKSAQALFFIHFVNTKRLVDTDNLNTAAQDVIKDYKIIIDDNFNLIPGTGGVTIYDKNRDPGTLVYILNPKFETIAEKITRERAECLKN